MREDRYFEIVNKVELHHLKRYKRDNVYRTYLHRKSIITDFILSYDLPIEQKQEVVMVSNLKMSKVTWLVSLVGFTLIYYEQVEVA